MLSMTSRHYGTAFTLILICLGPKANGRVFKTRYIQTAYNNAVAAAKLDDVNFHTLRHTFASWAVMRGVTLKELQASRPRLAGHDDAVCPPRTRAPSHGGQPS
jgi:integrase